jgi:hypothetical protein
MVFRRSARGKIYTGSALHEFYIPHFIRCFLRVLHADTRPLSAMGFVERRMRSRVHVRIWETKSTGNGITRVDLY